MEEVCCVCGDALEEDNMSRCRMCGGSFHLAWSTGSDIKECGSYFFHEQTCGLSFICRNCEPGLSADRQSPSQFTTS